MPLLTVHDLEIRSRRRTLVGPLRFTLDAGERIALVGPSGSGKSLTAAALLGTLSPVLDATGSIMFALPDGPSRAVSGLSAAERRRLPNLPRLAFVHQDSARALNPQTTVGAHLKVALSRGPLEDAGPLEEAGPLASASHLLRALAFEDPERIAASLPHELSGGQRQRVCLALALARRPHLLVADEPTTALDEATQAQVLDLIDQLLPASAALLFITHDHAAARALRATTLRMREGRIEAGDDPSTAPPRTACPAGPLTPISAPSPRIASPRMAVAERAAPAEPGDTPAPVLEARALRVAYAQRRPGTLGRASSAPFTALCLDHLRVPEGQRLGIVGPSGSGKSTLLRALLGLAAPTSGEVLYRGAPLLSLGRDEVRAMRRDVQVIVQDARGSLNPRARAIDQASEPGRSLAPRRLRRAERAAVRARAAEALEAVHLDPALWRARPHQLSGGQAQRVAIARALATDPSVLVADEPLAGLDPALRERVEDTLEAILAARPAMGLVMVSHDLSSVERLCTRVLRLDGGSLVNDRPTTGAGS
ncbi:MAG: ATP-binding cassette domain-containing protein [Dermabacter sp.]|nr:ATP-binding cassette domain-containing protein [Dermabacter sp.]